MGDSKCRPLVADHQWLSIYNVGGTSGGVAHMADGDVALESLKDIFREYLGNQPHILVHADLLAVGSDDTGTLLTTVLQGIKA